MVSRLLHHKYLSFLFLFFSFFSVSLGRTQSLEKWTVEAEKKGMENFSARMHQIENQAIQASKRPFFELFKSLGKSNYEEQYIAVLAITKKPDVTKEQLITVLKHPDWRLRCVLTSYIRELGINFEDKVTLIRMAISDENPKVRAGAAFLVGNYHLTGLILPLIENFSLKDKELVGNTASALYKLGIWALPAIPNLLTYGSDIAPDCANPNSAIALRRLLSIVFSTALGTSVGRVFFQWNLDR